MIYLWIERDFCRPLSDRRGWRIPLEAGSASDTAAAHALIGQSFLPVRAHRGPVDCVYQSLAQTDNKELFTEENECRQVACSFS